jgi:hypothetical protein
MGRVKISDERKAKNLSVSLLPKHKLMLEEIGKKLHVTKTSDIIQKLIEKEMQILIEEENQKTVD